MPPDGRSIRNTRGGVRSEVLHADQAHTPHAGFSYNPAGASTDRWSHAVKFDVLIDSFFGVFVTKAHAVPIFKVLRAQSVMPHTGKTHLAKEHAGLCL